MLFRSFSIWPMACSMAFRRALVSVLFSRFAGALASMADLLMLAFSVAVPLVTAAAKGPAWLVRDGEDALLTPVDDAGALAAAINKLIASRALAETLVANGRRRIEEEFSEGAVVRRYIEFFEKVRR